VKVHCWNDRSQATRLIKRPLLVRGTPRLSITPQKDPLAKGNVRCPVPESNLSFLR
jgi:hypothetical protein